MNGSLNGCSLPLYRRRSGKNLYCSFCIQIDPSQGSSSFFSFLTRLQLLYQNSLQSKRKFLVLTRMFHHLAKTAAVKKRLTAI